MSLRAIDVVLGCVALVFSVSLKPAREWAHLLLINAETRWCFVRRRLSGCRVGAASLSGAKPCEGWETSIDTNMTCFVQKHELSVRMLSNEHSHQRRYVSQIFLPDCWETSIYPHTPMDWNVLLALSECWEASIHAGATTSKISCLKCWKNKHSHFARQKIVVVWMLRDKHSCGCYVYKN